MNSFCKNCRHRDIPQVLKKKFDEKIEPFFGECPLDNEKIVYCFTERYRVDWLGVISILLEEEGLSAEEIEELEKLGKDEIDRRRGF